MAGNLTHMGRGRPKGSKNKLGLVLKAYAQQYTEEAINGLLALARGSRVPAAARVMAWREVLDRGHGKAPQALTDADGGGLVPREVIHQHILGIIEADEARQKALNP